MPSDVCILHIPKSQFASQVCGSLRSPITDLGPPHSFWCFAFERMNGALAGAPNSNRCVEVEVANRFLRDTAIATTDITNIDTVPFSLREFIRIEGNDDGHALYPQTVSLLMLLDAGPDTVKVCCPARYRQGSY